MVICQLRSRYDQTCCSLRVAGGAAANGRSSIIHTDYLRVVQAVERAEMNCFGLEHKDADLCVGSGVGTQTTF